MTMEAVATEVEVMEATEVAVMAAVKVNTSMTRIPDTHERPLMTDTAIAIIQSPFNHRCKELALISELVEKA